MSAVQLKAVLNATRKVFDNACNNPHGGSLKPSRCQTIFTRDLSLKIFDQIENLTSVWKCIEIELPGLTNLEKLSFVMFSH